MAQLTYRETGTQESDTCIVLLHGLFGSSANWGGVARHLADRYRLVIPDLRNHGRSPHLPDVSYQAHAEDLLALFDQLDLKRVVLVGHSMGGKVAMQLALQQPETVQGLAIVDMAPVTYGHDFAAIFAGFDAVQLDGLKNRAEADRMMAAHIAQPGVRAFLLQNLVRSDERWGWRANLDVLRPGQALITGFSPPEGSVFEGPSSFIYGELSDYVKPDYQTTIDALFPKAVMCQVEGAGHWVYAEQLERFMVCLNDFLQTIEK